MSQPTDKKHATTLVFNDLTDEVQINGQTYLLIKKDQLSHLLNTLKEQKSDINELKNCVVEILKFMNLYDDQTGNIKEAIRTGEESYFKHIIKALKDVMQLMIMSKVSKDSEAELAQKFAFLKTLLAIIPKYAGNNK